ncbi:MAG TPA: hypothetical protein VEU62_24080 [Bryobacterales bacterium]|nr:hypothetical protein [Bryobacterales bacterium]
MTDKPSYDAGFGSDALKEPQRVVFVTRKTSAKVRGRVERQLMSFPHLLLREAIALQALTIGLVVIALLWDAPLEQLANPLVTPNPAKAPWYFLGLQELLHYFPPVVAGILIPTLVVLALVVIPYSNVNIEGRPLWEANGARRFRLALTVIAALLLFLAIFRAWTVLAPTVAVGGLLAASYLAPPQPGWRTEYLRGRPLSWWVMTWFIAVALTLTLVGTFFRGPGWSWVWPWR